MFKNQNDNLFGVRKNIKKERKQKKRNVNNILNEWMQGIIDFNHES